MKKKYLPIIVLLFIVSFSNVSEAVTRHDIEFIMGSLIHGKERNMPNLTPVILPSADATRQETQETQDQSKVVIEHEKLENDPYSYETPKNTKVEQRPKINVIKIPHFGEEGEEDRKSQAEYVVPSTSQSDVQQAQKTQEEATAEQKPKINVIKIPHFGTEKEEEKCEEERTVESPIPTILTPGTETQTSENEDCTSSVAPEPPQQPVQNLTRQEVFLTCLTKMGWASTLALLKQLVIFEEYSDISPVDFVRTNMTPAPPADLFTPADEIFPNEDLMKLKKWAKKCVKDVQLEAKLTVNGNSLCFIKRGVPTPSGYVQDMDTKNVPLFIVYYIHNKKKNMAHVEPSEQLGADKLPLSTIANATEGAEFAINGGYFGAGIGQIIGVLRFKGKNMRANFWPHRSGIAWNNSGEHKFFDGKVTQSVVNDRNFDKYTEAFQAGPMLIFNGRISQNSEDVHASVMNKRHPRTFVAEQRDGTLVWGVVDGRDAAYSVGMTVDELKRFCKERHFVNALNLDGGGSSSVWWNGLRFSKPCNQSGAERKIPYAIVVYHENAEAICAPIESSPQQQNDQED